MKKLLAIGLCLAFLMPVIAMGQDTKEVITLKKELSQQKVQTVQLQIQLMQERFANAQDLLKQLQVEITGYDEQLKAMEAADKPQEEEKSE